MVFQYDQHLNDVTARYLKKLNLQSPFSAVGIPASTQPVPTQPVSTNPLPSATPTPTPTQPAQTVGGTSGNYANPASTPTAPAPAQAPPPSPPITTTPIQGVPGTSTQSATPTTSPDQTTFQQAYPDKSDADYTYAYSMYNAWAANNMVSPGADLMGGGGGSHPQMSFGQWLSRYGNTLLFDSGNPTQDVTTWLGSTNISDQQKFYLQTLAPDLYRSYQDSQLVSGHGQDVSFRQWLTNLGPDAFLQNSGKITYGRQELPLSYSDANTSAYYLNYIDQLPGMSQDQKDQLKGQYQDLLSQYTVARDSNRFANPSWSWFLSQQNPQSILSHLPDQHPDLLYQNWVQNQGLSPVQQQELLGRFQPIYANFYAAQQQDPNLRFSDYLNSVSSQNQLALAPEQDTSQTYANFISHMPGITPQMRSTLENRYFPVYSNYLNLYNQNPQQYYSFSNYLNQFFNPQQVLSQVPNSAPVAANQTFANRLRWFGY